MIILDVEQQQRCLSDLFLGVYSRLKKRVVVARDISSLWRTGPPHAASKGAISTESADMEPSVTMKPTPPPLY